VKTNILSYVQTCHLELMVHNDKDFDKLFL